MLFAMCKKATTGISCHCWKSKKKEDMTERQAIELAADELEHLSARQYGVVLEKHRIMSSRLRSIAQRRSLIARVLTFVASFFDTHRKEVRKYAS
jgi:hypothetical protein